MELGYQCCDIVFAILFASAYLAQWAPTAHLETAHDYSDDYKYVHIYIGRSR